MCAPAGATGTALIEALQNAQIRTDESTVTLDATLPRRWATLVIGQVAK